MGFRLWVGAWVTDLDVHAAAKGEHHALVRVWVWVWVWVWVRVRVRVMVGARVRVHLRVDG